MINCIINKDIKVIFILFCFSFEYPEDFLFFIGLTVDIKITEMKKRNIAIFKLSSFFIKMEYKQQISIKTALVVIKHLEKVFS